MDGSEGGGVTWGSGEDLGDMEGLGQEALDLAGTGHGHLVLLTQLIHTQDGNDILQVLVRLREPICIDSEP